MAVGGPSSSVEPGGVKSQPALTAIGYALDNICARGYGASVWDIEVTDQFVDYLQ